MLKRGRELSVLEKRSRRKGALEKRSSIINSSRKDELDKLKVKSKNNKRRQN
jgi:hypothetical protein